jgi:hypothetical protein
MALTIDVLRANAALAGLTDEQLTAITTLSVNDENSVIAKKTGEPINLLRVVQHEKRKIPYITIRGNQHIFIAADVNIGRVISFSLYGLNQPFRTSKGIIKPRQPVRQSLLNICNNPVE